MTQLTTEPTPQNKIRYGTQLKRTTIVKQPFKNVNGRITIPRNNKKSRSLKHWQNQRNTRYNKNNQKPETTPVCVCVGLCRFWQGSIDVYLKGSPAEKIFNPAYYNGAMLYPCLPRSRWLIKSKALESFRKIRMTALSSSSQFVSNSSATRQMVSDGRRDRWPAIISFRMESNVFRTTDVRLFGLKCFGMLWGVVLQLG